MRWNKVKCDDLGRGIGTVRESDMRLCVMG